MKNFYWLSVLAAVLVLPASGLRAADANHDFVKWEPEISAFERADATNPPAKGGCLFIGSSTVRLWKTLAQDLPDQQVINRGFGGSEIVDATHFADRIVFPYAPRMVFLRAGGNDLAAGNSVESVFGDFKDFVTMVQGRLPDAEIVFIGLSPTIARWTQHGREKALNGLIQDFIRGRAHLHYIDDYAVPLGPDGQPRSDLLAGDKLHFNTAGYKVLAECVREQWPK